MRGCRVKLTGSVYLPQVLGWDQVAIRPVQCDLGCEVVDRDGEGAGDVDGFALEMQGWSAGHGEDREYVQWDNF